MLGSEYAALAVRLTTVVVPVAMYFLILGLLNSRRHPQFLTGRRDFLLLVVALSPVAILPALHYVGPSPVTAAAAIAVAAVAIYALAPRGRTWVIYNVSRPAARGAVARALQAMGESAEPAGDGFRLPDAGARLSIGGFPLLRNVSLRLEGGGRDLTDRFESALGQTLGQMQAETTPMAVSLLLIATAMIVAPLAMVAPRVPEIVRILTDLLP